MLFSIVQMFQFMFMVQLLVKFRFFIQELWERKSLQILYECWRRAYKQLLAQLFIFYVTIRVDLNLVILWLNESIFKVLFSFA